jgi:hypothetical protein
VGATPTAPAELLLAIDSPSAAVGMGAAFAAAIDSDSKLKLPVLSPMDSERDMICTE